MIGFGPVQNSMGGAGVGATYFLPTVKYSATGTDTGVPGPNPFVNQPGVTFQSDKGATPRTSTPAPPSPATSRCASPRASPAS